jgi:hypothetical protein
MCHPFPFAVHVEESQHPFGLLEGLNQPIQEKAVEAPVARFASPGVVAPLAEWLATKRPRPVPLRPGAQAEGD